MTASVTAISDAPSIRPGARHSWDKQPRRDDPTRHVYTCRRDGCGLKRRSELVDGEWLDFWLWPDGEQDSGRRVPPCRGGTAVEPTPVALTVAAVPVEAATTPPCCRCVPPLKPCGQPTHLYLAGYLCDFQARLSPARTTNGGDVA